MKRLVSAIALGLLLTGGVFAYRTIDACDDWQERYKRFLYTEMLKNSPIIHTPEMIEEIIGECPAGCEIPSSRVSDADFQRYRREGVGPKEFQD